MFRKTQGGNSIVDRIRSLTGGGKTAVSTQSMIEQFEAEARATRDLPADDRTVSQEGDAAFPQPGYDHPGGYAEAATGYDGTGYGEMAQVYDQTDAGSAYPYDPYGHDAQGQMPEGHWQGDAAYPAPGMPFEAAPAETSAEPKRSLFARLRGKGKTGGVKGGEINSADLSFENGVVSFGKKKSAVGLSWTTVDGKSPQELASTIDMGVSRDIASDPVRYNLFADLRRNGFAGFGSTDLDHARGMPSLVTAMSSESTGPRWIGAFQMAGSDIWWIGSMRNGQVFEDKIIHGETAARDALLQELHAPDWSMIFAPSIWGIPGASHATLDKITDFSEATRLSYVAPLRVYLPRIILGVLLLAIVAGGLSWYGEKKRRELAELEEMRRQAASQTTVSPSDYPSYHAPRVADAVEACEAEIARTIMLIPGWESQPIACNIGQGGALRIDTGWTRVRGHFATLVAAVPADRPTPVLSPDGVLASYAHDFTMPFEAEANPAEPWTEALITRRLRERFTTYGLDIVIQPTSSNVPEATATVVFNSTDLQISSAVSLQNYGDILDDIPALAPQAVIYNVGTGNWDLIMKAYHPAILPAPQPGMPY